MEITSDGSGASGRNPIASILAAFRPSCGDPAGSKPVITWLQGAWFCWIKGGQHVGFGSTPASAYHGWRGLVDKAYRRAELEAYQRAELEAQS